MALITIKEVSIRFRGPQLLDRVTCQIESRQRIGLLGRNGSGKTTLMRMLCGEVEPDEGEFVVAPSTTVSLLPQDVPRQLHGRVINIVAQGMNPSTLSVDSTLRGTDVASDAGASRSPDEMDINELDWKSQHAVDQILSRMSLDGNGNFEELSSGMKRRVLLARTLVSKPDVLLLDEPTNHLDIDSIAWLEKFLGRWDSTFIFVTHDRMFLNRLATRILEIDRGRLFDWSCDYETFLSRKEAAVAAEEKQNALFDKKLAQEEVWIRQGIKARRTRNEGRVRALEQLRRERQQRRAANSNVKMQIQQGDRSGRLVAKIDKISFAFDDLSIIRDFSTTIMRGDKIGLIGPNGAGKTTLLRLLLGKLSPQSGSVRLGTNLEIVYFDQLREQLDDDRTVQENVAGGADAIQIGSRSRHIMGYLQDFLFTPERARMPVRFLSGGERNRVLLARLFTKPANVIVLDEPTNDLDTETLELLEERLVKFEGTVIVVSHDRAFLNNLVTSTIVFEDGDVKEYSGGYDDWLLQRSDQSSTDKTSSRKKSNSDKKVPTAQQPNAATEQKRRLTFNEQRELSALPATIEQLESSTSELHETMSQPSFYQQAGEQIADAQSRLTELERQLADAYQRWEKLEQLAH